MRNRSFIQSCSAVAILAASVVVCSAARAQGSIALAEKLFQDGRELFTGGYYDAACPKFKESYRLDPGAGTLLNLAACHEKQGRTATAWSEYELARQELTKNEDGRATYAASQAEALKAKLSYLTIQIQEAETPGMKVTLNETRLGAAIWGTESPVDPGEHRVSVEAPGHEGWSTTVEVGKDSARVTVTVPPLVPEENTTRASSGPGTGNVSDAPSENWLTTPVIVSGSTTLAMGALFTVSGLAYLNRREQSQDENHNNRAAARSRAETWGVVNLVGAGGTIIGLGLTAYFLASGNSDDDAPMASVAPWFGPNGGGALLQQRF